MIDSELVFHLVHSASRRVKGFALTLGSARGDFLEHVLFLEARSLPQFRAAWAESGGVWSHTNNLSVTLCSRSAVPRSLNISDNSTWRWLDCALRDGAILRLLCWNWSWFWSQLWNLDQGLNSFHICFGRFNMWKLYNQKHTCSLRQLLTKHTLLFHIHSIKNYFYSSFFIANGCIYQKAEVGQICNVLPLYGHFTNTI